MTWRTSIGRVALVQALASEAPIGAERIEVLLGDTEGTIRLLEFVAYELASVRALSGVRTRAEDLGMAGTSSE